VERKDGGPQRWSVVESEDGGRSGAVESTTAARLRWSTRAVEGAAAAWLCWSARGCVDGTVVR
jgi:hypothetical protein